MKRLMIVVLVLLVGLAALGYWRGWFNISKGDNTDVKVDPAKFKQDREALSKTVVKETNALKERIAGLWRKTEGLTGDEKVQAKKELAELEKKHERLEKQLKELEDADADKFEGLKQDLSKSLEEVEKKIDELTHKLSKVKDK
jgi:chromosome segregation ATPase